MEELQTAINAAEKAQTVWEVFLAIERVGCFKKIAQSGSRTCCGNVGVGEQTMKAASTNAMKASLFVLAIMF